MKFIVWTKDEFNDFWARQECADTEALKTVIINEMKTGKKIEVTALIEYKFNVELPGITVPFEKPLTAKEKFAKGVETSAENAITEIPAKKH